MNRRLWLILGLVLFLIFGGLVALAISGDRDNEPAESSSSSSFNPAIYMGAFLPMIVAISQMQRPEYPVQQVFYQLRHAKPEVLAKRIAPYLSRDFRSSNRHADLLQSEPLAALQVTKSEPSEPARISVLLRDGSRYTCRVVPRDKSVDGAGYGKWVIDDLQGPGLS